MSSMKVQKYLQHVLPVIAYIRCYGHELRLDEDPIMALLEATGCITAENAQGWFQDAGYIVTE